MDKRYIVFACDDHYPSGGWDDKYGEAATIPEAKEMLEEAVRKKRGYGFGHIIDWVSRKKVASYDLGEWSHD